LVVGCKISCVGSVIGSISVGVSTAVAIVVLNIAAKVVSTSTGAGPSVSTGAGADVSEDAALYWVAQTLLRTAGAAPQRVARTLVVRLLPRSCRCHAESDCCTHCWLCPVVFPSEPSPALFFCQKEWWARCGHRL
jgi:hypothetical protein